MTPTTSGSAKQEARFSIQVGSASVSSSVRTTISPPADLDPGVAGADDPAVVAVGDHLDVGEGLVRPGEQLRVVVDDHDRLGGGERLSLDRAQAARELVAALRVPGRNDHRDAVLGCVLVTVAE